MPSVDTFKHWLQSPTRKSTFPPFGHSDLGRALQADNNELISKQVDDSSVTLELETMQPPAESPRLRATAAKECISDYNPTTGANHTEPATV